jgi:hypothetical protein
MPPSLTPSPTQGKPKKLLEEVRDLLRRIQLTADGAAQRVERVARRRTLPIMGANGAGDVAAAAVVEQVISHPNAPERRGTHPSRCGQVVAIVANLVTEGAHVVREEVRERIEREVPRHTNGFLTRSVDVERSGVGGRTERGGDVAARATSAREERLATRHLDLI